MPWVIGRFHSIPFPENQDWSGSFTLRPDETHNPTACSDSAKLHHLQPKDCPTCKDQLILNWFAHQASSCVFSFCSLYTTFLASCHGEKRVKQIWDLENTLLHRFYIKWTWNQNLTDWCMVQPRCPMAAIIMPGALGLCFKRCLVHQSNLNAECATSSVHLKQRRHKNNLKLKTRNTKSNNTSTTTEVSPNNPSHHLQKRGFAKYDKVAGLRVAKSRSTTGAWLLGGPGFSLVNVRPWSPWAPPDKHPMSLGGKVLQSSPNQAVW